MIEFLIVFLLVIDVMCFIYLYERRSMWYFIPLSCIIHSFILLWKKQ